MQFFSSFELLFDKFMQQVSVRSSRKDGFISGVIEGFQELQTNSSVIASTKASCNIVSAWFLFVLEVCTCHYSPPQLTAVYLQNTHRRARECPLMSSRKLF